MGCGWMLLGTLISVLAISSLFPLVGWSPAPDGPQFEGEQTLRRPLDYREWIFLSSSLGLRYPADPDSGSGEGEVYHNVYINPPAYREFKKTGRFPDGTMMVLELLSEERKKEPGLVGSFQKEIVGLEASVRDSRRFPETTWAYFSFDSREGLKEKTEPMAAQACWSCHTQKAQTDHVFTQFYPTLRKR